MFAATGLASVAGADTWSDPNVTGIEICKTTVAPTVNLTIPFTYTVTAGATPGGAVVGHITAPVNSTTTNMICSAPLPLAAGAYTVTEDQASAAWNKVNSITPFAGQSIGTPNLVTGSVAVTVTTDNISGVTYSDSLVSGYVEVCKAAAAGSGLTGAAVFNFTLTGGDGMSASASAPVGQCSSPVSVPAGSVKIVEGSGVPSSLFVTSITSPNGAALSGTSLSTGTTNVNVAPAAAGNTSIQSDVLYTNNVVTLKVCKNFTGSPDPVSSYPFTFSAAGTNATAAGGAASGSLSVPVGGCQVAGVYPAGTVATVTEGVVPGTKVFDNGTVGIVAQNGATVVPTTLNVTARTVQVVLGNSTGEGLVTYTDTPATPGELKLCVNGSVATGTPSVSFVTSGPDITTATTVVSQGQCVPVGGVSSPTPIPFNETVKVVGTASTGNVFLTSTVPTTPTDVWEVVNGVLTDTGVTTVVTPPGAVISPANVETESVVISEGLITEVSYTDPVAAPATIVGPVVTTPGPAPFTPVVTTSSSGSNGSSIGLGTSSSTGNTSTLISTPKVLLTKAQIKAELKKFNKELTSLKAAERSDASKLSHLKGHARTHEAALVKKLQGEIRTVTAQIKALNKLNK